MKKEHKVKPAPELTTTLVTITYTCPGDTPGSTDMHFITRNVIVTVNKLGIPNYRSAPKTIYCAIHKCDANL